MLCSADQSPSEVQVKIDAGFGMIAGDGFVFAAAKTGLGADAGASGFGTAGFSTTLVAPKLNDKNSPFVSAGEKIAPAGCGVA